ncbi:MAG: chromosomal replication initiator protein DnaA [Treponema sp.]|nr:chromosomal replication initiator protein DnaA [Treponema sp.]
MADLEYRTFWDKTLSLLKKELGDEEYGIWFNKVEYLRTEGQVLYALVPSTFFLEMFKSKYLPRITSKLGELAGEGLTITLEVPKKGEKSRGAPPHPPHVEGNPAPSGQKNPSSNDSGSAQTSAAKEGKKNNSQLQEEYTFDTYVVGEVNNYAYNAALAVARNPGISKIYNPLLIYGGTGFGKTHLMQAIGHYIHQNSDLKILYITGEGFMREFVETVALSQKNKDAFAKKYRNVDALLIDDIHTIERGVGTQDELFYTFEALYNKKKQMIFTCDRPISELKGMAPRLQSRFHWGLSVELQLPRYEELIAILRKKMTLKKMELKKDIFISDEIIEMIIKNISSNVRDMEGALNKLMGYADLVNKPVTVEIAQRELKDIFADPKQGNMSMDLIQRVVAEEYHLTPNDLKGKKRTASIVRPRQISMYLCRELTEYSLTEIGQVFGDRDHTTVLHSCNRVEEESRSDTNLYSSLERLKRMIKEHNVK